jgi:hypothetical protein
VALGSPLPQTGGLREPPAVANPRSYEHSIEHYLVHPQVATTSGFRSWRGLESHLLFTERCLPNGANA